MLLSCFWNEIILWRHSYLMQSNPEISGARIWMVSVITEISGARHKRVKNICIIFRHPCIPKSGKWDKIGIITIAYNLFDLDSYNLYLASEKKIRTLFKIRRPPLNRQQQLFISIFNHPFLPKVVNRGKMVVIWPRFIKLVSKHTRGV